MEILESPYAKIIQFLTSAKNYLRSPSEPDRLFTKGKKIEVVYVVVSKNLPLFRTEGVGDVTEFTVHTRSGLVTVPAIMPEKIQAKLRRRILEILREHSVQPDTLKKYSELKFKKIARDKDGKIAGWNCYVAPPESDGGTDIGMCGFCPACSILGSILDKNVLDMGKGGNTPYGVKSRVVHDPAYAVVRREKAETIMKHNKVGDGLSYTGRSLFDETHILPSVVFVGKLAMYDVTRAEAKLVLSALSSISRMGGGETKYGSVQVIIVGLRAGNRETISSYDIARHVIEEKNGDMVSPEEALKLIADYIEKKGFTVVIDRSKPIDELDTHIEMKSEEIASIWEQDNYEYAKQIVEYIMKVRGAKKEDGGGEEDREKPGEDSEPGKEEKRKKKK